MGLLRWLRGGDDADAATSAMSAGMSVIDEVFRPSQHKQTEHVEETKRLRHDVGSGGIDLEAGKARLVLPSK